METKDSICRIPVQATMKRQEDGSYKMIDAVYQDIPADLIARFLLRKCGIDAIFGDSEAGG